MAHSSSAQSISTAETTFTVPFCPISRSRTRALSLLSISSGTSVHSVFEITKGEATVIVSQKPEKHEAWGSFIPLRSATTCLREFISVAPSYTNQSSPKRRRTSSYGIRTPASSYRENSKTSSPEIPYITRTPSPTSPSSSMISHNVHSDLHPILARLEKKSKLCTKKVYCSTCGKAGSDFPRCGKCGEFWCSRSCRLVEGKRHVCSSRT
ncbi:hypothetical protein BYT27DRAFT_7189209 [Phlegmacium glaucopus]|nr:hypothetical protein BYT27DRAFT_7189209 [Phlegmacium glaucopus]